jgi:hypothetical protein
MGFFVVFDGVRNSVLTAWPDVFHVSTDWVSVPSVDNLVGWEVSEIRKSARFASERRAVSVARTIAAHFQENNEEVDFKVLKLATQVEERCEEIVLL